MENQQADKAIYEAIIRIRKINKKIPYEESIWKEASKTSGLAIYHLCETLLSLVDAGSIRVDKTLKGKDSYFISNIDDSETMTELESQCDIYDDMSELVNMDFPTPRAEFHPEKEASSIEKTDFLVFLDLIGKLTEDLRGLQFKIDESTKKNEKLLSENYELKLENAILHTKLEESRKAENVTSVVDFSPNNATSLCGIQNTSKNTIKTQRFSPIVIEDIQGNQIVQDYNRENSKESRKKAKKQDHYNKHLKRCVRDQNNGTLNEKSKCSPAKGKVKEIENRKKEKNKEFENHKERKSTTTTTVIIGDSMVKNVQSWRMRRLLSHGDKIFVKSFSGATTDDMSFYAVPSSRTKPDKMIIDTGVNDLINENNNKKVAQNITALAESIKTEESQVSIQA